LLLVAGCLLLAACCLLLAAGCWLLVASKASPRATRKMIRSLTIDWLKAENAAIRNPQSEIGIVNPGTSTL
jgi:hypothetical protein